MKRSEIQKELLTKVLELTSSDLSIMKSEVLKSLDEQTDALNLLLEDKPSDNGHAIKTVRNEIRELYALKYKIESMLYQEHLNSIILTVKQEHKDMILRGEQKHESLFDKWSKICEELPNKCLNPNQIAKNVQSDAEIGIDNIIEVFERIKSELDVDIFTNRLSSFLKDYISARYLQEKEDINTMNNKTIDIIIKKFKQRHFEMINRGEQEPQSLFITIGNSFPQQEKDTCNPFSDHEFSLNIDANVYNEAEKAIEELIKVLKFLKTDSDVDIFMIWLASLKKDLVLAKNSLDDDYNLRMEDTNYGVSPYLIDSDSISNIAREYGLSADLGITPDPFFQNERYSGEL